MQPREAGRRLILLSIPFLAFGLLLAIDPPIVDQLGSEVDAIVRTLGAALAILAGGALVMGVWLIQRGDERIL